MEKIPRGFYTKELREQAVKQVMEGGEPVKAVAIRLSMPEGTLKKLVTAARDGNLAEIGTCAQKTGRNEARAGFFKKVCGVFVKESR